MDIRAIGERLGKQAADAGYAERMARVKQLAAQNPAAMISSSAAEGVRQGVGNLVNAYSFGLSDRYGLTHTGQYANDAANRWSKGLALTSAIAAPVGGALKGGGKLMQGLSRLLGARRMAAVAGGTRAVAKTVPSVARTTASTIGYFAVPRPVSMASMTLRLPSMLGKHVAAPVVRGTGRLIGRIPGVQGAISRIAATRGGQALSHGGRVLRASGHQFMRNRPMTALSRAAKFVEGRGGLGSKAFMAADAGVPMYAGIKLFDPEAEALARAQGYDSRYVADVSPTPGLFMPAARLQYPLIDAVPGMVNERRMRQWIEQNRDALIQEQTAQQTAAIKELQSRRY